ncbi:MAG: guanylate kinase, partial [Lachnospiraceae bacterium]|nr:guanylate kinase [Lachnospiraceae bacterium]
MKRKGILIVVSGFSGAGKGTLVKKLLEEYEGYALSISATTRQPSPGEEDGREYFFLQKEQFERKIAENGLIEYACYCENYYGTPREYVDRQLADGKNVILEIEIQGALKIKKQYEDALLLFVMPPSAEELRRRLEKRGTETEEVIDKRMRRAAEEAEGIEAYDYIVINDDLDSCVRQLH